MPKSKRARIVHTSRVQKKPSKEKSAALFTAVRDAATRYPHLFVFRVENMRNTFLKDLRQHFNTDARLFYGKTKVMAKAMGMSAVDEFLPGLSELARWCKGDVGLLCTSRDVEEVVGFFRTFVEVDFARAGVVAKRKVVVPEGVVYSTAGEQAEEDDVPLPHSLEVTVRKWGMPTRLEKGKVMLDQEFVLCEKGKTLNSNQTALLKLFGIAMAEFRVTILAVWRAETGEVVVVDGDGDEEHANGVLLSDVGDEMEEG